VGRPRKFLFQTPTVKNTISGALHGATASEMTRGSNLRTERAFRPLASCSPGAKYQTFLQTRLRLLCGKWELTEGKEQGQILLGIVCRKGMHIHIMASLKDLDTSQMRRVICLNTCIKCTMMNFFQYGHEWRSTTSGMRHPLLSPLFLFSTYLFSSAFQYLFLSRTHAHAYKYTCTRT
jgi:hypothetical protein